MIVARFADDRHGTMPGNTIHHQMMTHRVTPHGERIIPTAAIEYERRWLFIRPPAYGIDASHIIFSEIDNRLR